MNQVRINIAEQIGTSNAIIQNLGNQIFEAASSFVKSGKSIILDFDGVKNLTSGFCNASIGQLYSTFPSLSSEKIIIENVDKSSIWYEKIQDSIILAQNPEKADIIDNAILALFD